MGVDLTPLNPPPTWPRYPAITGALAGILGADEGPLFVAIRYNWASWRDLTAKLVAWGHGELVRRLPQGNDGEVITAEDCEVIAAALEDHPYNLAVGATSSISRDPQVCNVCGPLAADKIAAGHTCKRCSGCKGSRYCSAECQRKDWRSGHRTVCKHMADAVALNQKYVEQWRTAGGVEMN